MGRASYSRAVRRSVRSGGDGWGSLESGHARLVRRGRAEHLRLVWPARVRQPSACLSSLLLRLRGRDHRRNPARREPRDPDLAQRAQPRVTSSTSTMPTSQRERRFASRRACHTRSGGLFSSSVPARRPSRRDYRRTFIAVLTRKTTARLRESLRVTPRRAPHPDLHLRTGLAKREDAFGAQQR